MAVRYVTKDENQMHEALGVGLVPSPMGLFLLNSEADLPDVFSRLPKYGFKNFGKRRKDMEQLSKRQRGYLYRKASRTILGKLLLGAFRGPPTTKLEAEYWKLLINLRASCSHINKLGEASSKLGAITFDSALKLGHYIYNSEKLPQVVIGGKPMISIDPFEVAEFASTYHRCMTHSFQPELIPWSLYPPKFRFEH